MNKKFKYTSLVAAGAVTLGLVGGTLAWFSAQDVETNKFNTVGNNQGGGRDDLSIQIVEDWKEEAAKDMTAGTEVNKDVQVKNVDSYDQFIKVNLKVNVRTPQYKKDNSGNLVKDANGNLVFESWKSEYKNVLKGNDGTYYVEGYDQITLQVTNHVTSDGELGTWYYKLDSVTEGEGDTATTTNFSNFYYVGQVKAGSHTNTLLDSVTLLETAGASYKNIQFDVIVTADGIQTTNNAAEKQWDIKDSTVKGFYDYKKASTEEIANGVLIDTEGYIVDVYGNKTTLAYGVANPIDDLEKVGTSETHDHNGAQR